MLITTITAQTQLTRLHPTEYSYVWGTALIYDTAGTYWETVFGAPHESATSAVQVEAFRVNDVDYVETDSVADCVATEKTWFFDPETQRFHVHLDHDVDGYSARVGYGRAIGFTDSEVVSIDDVEYLPMIISVPSLAQVQDLINYDKLATINGEMVLSNVGGELDYLITLKIIGGDAKMYHLPDESVESDGSAPASDLQPLAAFFVEDFKPGLETFRLSLQDKRLSQDAPFPVDRFSVANYPDLDDSSLDTLIPVVYGYQRELKAYPTNGKAASTTVRYRAGLLLTVLTAVYLKIDGTWTVATPSNISLSTGEFDVAGAKSSTTSAPYECKIEATGIPVAYASDVIKDLNSRFGGVGFEVSFYDLAEWNTEQVALSTVGPVFKEETTIFEAAQQIQAGATIGFRYEINASGKRTIRIDDEDRVAAVLPIDNVDILNADKIDSDFDTEFLAAQVRIGYARSDESGKYLTVLNDSKKADVFANYRSMKSVIFDTLLTNSTDAEARALLDATRLYEPKKTAQVTLVGAEYLALRIFDIIPIALTQDPVELDTRVVDGREFLGVKMCKVVGVDPDYKTLTNSVTLQILDREYETEINWLIYDEFDELVLNENDRGILSYA